MQLLRLSVCWILLIPTVNYAWNATGHVIISRLAYKHLTPEAKDYVFRLLGISKQKDKIHALDENAIWLDHMRYGEFKKTGRLHYINIPFGDEHFFPRLGDENAVHALLDASQVLNNKNSNFEQKKYSLRILLHVIGDIHQPMHAITYYSKHFPHGDKGGNSYKIRKYLYHGSLHQFWDEASGWLAKTNPYDESIIRHKIKEFYPYQCSNENLNFLPSQWAKESYKIASSQAYFPPRSRIKFLNYQEKAEKKTKQQLNLAACRLAAELNHLAHSH